MIFKVQDDLNFCETPPRGINNELHTFDMFHDTSHHL